MNVIKIYSVIILIGIIIFELPKFYYLFSEEETYIMPQVYLANKSIKTETPKWWIFIHLSSGSLFLILLTFHNLINIRIDKYIAEIYFFFCVIVIANCFRLGPLNYSNAIIVNIGLLFISSVIKIYGKLFLFLLTIPILLEYLLFFKFIYSHI